MTIKLRATKDNPKYPEGTAYEAAPIVAASDVYLRRAVLEEHYIPPIETRDESTDSSAEVPKKKRTYHRRDMKAES